MAWWQGAPLFTAICIEIVIVFGGIIIIDSIIFYRRKDGGNT